ncbi:MAG: hypothetical protein AAGA72_05280 [Pseudomonadota bacterium]
MRPIFISHANDDKSKLAPLLVELHDRRIPFFIDQKHDVPWPREIRARILESPLIEEIGAADYNQKIPEALERCSLFVVLVTENVLHPTSGVLRELDVYVKKEMRPEPLLIKAEPISGRVELPSTPFLNDSYFQNIVRIHDDAFRNKTAHTEIANCVESLYQSVVRDELENSAVQRQRESANRFAAGVTTATIRLSGASAVDLIYVPNERLHAPGFFIAKTPVTALGRPGFAELNTEQLKKLLTKLPPKLGLPSAIDLGTCFPFVADGLARSPYVSLDCPADQAFWCQTKDEITPLTLAGTPAGSPALVLPRRL